MRPTTAVRHKALCHLGLHIYVWTYLSSSCYQSCTSCGTHRSTDRKKAQSHVRKQP